MADRAGTVPWRMTAGAYGDAVARPRSRVSLAGPLPETPWDPDLSPTMAGAGVAVYEEELRAQLLEAMAAAHPEPPGVVRTTILPSPG